MKQSVSDIYIVGYCTGHADVILKYIQKPFFNLSKKIKNSLTLIC